LTAKRRLDEILVLRKIASSVEEARARILAGEVRIGNERMPKAGMRYPEDCHIELSEKPPFVSRGGIKLEAALSRFDVSVSGRTCLDVGASTGGFTDCLLKRGAAKVYAVDTGYGKLDARLRSDGRVTLLERTNARNLSPLEVPVPIDVAAIDVSFISVRKVLPAVVALLAPDARLVVLVKPQFEAARGEVLPGGWIEDDAVRLRVVEEVAACAEGLGLVRLGTLESPIAGPAGNREVLLVLKKGGF
jgi:23S rRNA (cytidine1920-2'-O)/16S rRNA (cytidine1409-2'-O)-methyltransferase